MSRKSTSNRTYCLVPNCTSTSTKNPNKKFITLPKDKKRRLLWLKAVRRNLSDLSSKSCLCVCEDHFNWEEDVQNYVQFKYYKAKRIVLKPDVVPHIFACQTDRSTAQPPKERKAALNRVRRNLIQELTRPLESPIPSTSEASVFTETSPDDICFEKTSSGLFCATPNKIEAAEALCLLAHKTHADQGTQVAVDQQVKSTMTKPHVKSKLIQCNLMDRNVSTTTTTAACSPIRFRKLPKQMERVCEDDSSSVPSPGSSLSSFTKHQETEESLSPTDIVFPQDPRQMHLLLFESDTIFYFGVPKSHLNTISILIDCLKTNKFKILICLKKIRLDSTFKELGHQFGVSESYASKIFCTNVPTLAKCFSQLIEWPEKNKIKERLPIYFRARYANVQSIIDCFEIEIEKPLDPIKQTLTWSNYKKCNTMKYLISCTPDGLINFVSGGFGGRTSDTKIVEECGFLHVIPEGAAVMADRGFKGIASHLQKKNCVLIRPPSVTSEEQSSKQEVLLSKRIASLRIHIERVIRRVREFHMLKPHSCVNHKLIKYLDYIVQIVVGLINLQEPIMKQYV